MDEYIELEKAIKKLDHFQSHLHTVEGITAIGVAKTLIDEIPAADVRPVVLCRDCKRYGGRPWENNETGICARTDVGVGEFDFCSYGEKREVPINGN